VSYRLRLQPTTSLLAIAMVMVMAVSGGCNKATSEQKPLTPVRITVAQIIDTGTANRYSANIEPYQQVDLAFKSNGYLTSVRQVRDANGRMRNIDQGDWVTKGTVLATVQQDDYQQKLIQAKSQLARTQADNDRAKASFERMSALYAAGAATQPDYDNAQAQNLSTAAAVESAKASITEAQIALDYCQLRAPFDAWVLKRNVDVGQLVGPATNGFSLADMHTVKAVFGVPDIMIGRIKPGSTQTVTTDAVEGNFVGHVTSISPAADPKSRVYSVEVAIANSNTRLKSGMIASISIAAQHSSGRVMAVPLTAVVRSPHAPDAFAVFVAEGDGDTVKVHTADVKLGDTYGNVIAVVSGVSAGDHIVSTGATMIRDGEQVKVIQ